MKKRMENYLAKRADLDARPLVVGDVGGVDTVVAIPVLGEYESLFRTLESLGANSLDDLARTLVICIVNNRRSPLVDAEQTEDNQRTLGLLSDLTADREDARAARGIHGALRLAYIDAASPGCELPEDGGVGHARKIGMDWALGVFDESGALDTGNPIIFALDGDTTVEKGYLGVARRALEDGGAGAGVIEYAHRLEGDETHQRAIVDYELFLRYHVFGLRHADSPYAHHTIGSTMVCTADAYVKVSGMNTRQAGEDFYFLQQLAKTTKVAHIAATRVHPSGRPSRRVPFGTGYAVGRFVDDGHEVRAYHPACYTILKEWLETVSGNAEKNGAGLLRLAKEIDGELESFLYANNFESRWTSLAKNASDVKVLTHQFHRWFDALKTLRLIHHLRDSTFPLQELVESIGLSLPHWGYRLGSVTGSGELGERRELLEKLRVLGTQNARDSGLYVV